MEGVLGREHIIFLLRNDAKYMEIWQRNNLRLYDYSLGNYTVAVAVHTLWNTFFMHGCSDFFAKYICDFYHQELGTCFSLLGVHRGVGAASHVLVLQK